MSSARSRSVPAALLLAPLASTQIVEVEVRDEKAVRAQGPYLLERDGRVFLLGEPRWALERDAQGLPTIPQGEFYVLDLFVADPEHAEEVPYAWKNDAREPRWKAREATLPGKDLVAIRVLSAELTLENLAAEVRARHARIEALERQRASRTKASAAWFDAHYLVLEAQRRLQVLLEHHGFAPAARALDAEVGKLAKEAAKDERWARGQQAQASFRRADPPERLVQAAQAAADDEDAWSVYETRHLRLVCDERTSADEARALLGFGEEIIEGFRRELVDPYPHPDRIPERVFAEFWFGPDDDERYGRYYEEYYGLSFGSPDEKREALARRGRHDVYGSPGVFLAYYRAGRFDLRRSLAHCLGDVLVGIHYTDWLGSGYLGRLSWLLEAGGVDATLEYLGLYSEPCVSRRKDSTGKTEGRERRWNERPVAHQLALARACPKPLGQVVWRDLLDLGDTDLAKGWSFYRFLAADGARGQAALHAAARLAREPATFLTRWTEELGVLYAVKAGQDPLAALERLWRASLPPDEER